MPSKRKSNRSKRASRWGNHDHKVFLLQGGGALGAYQAGVYAGLAESGEAPDWIAGVSIGAINAALIAGNPPERRRHDGREGDRAAVPVDGRFGRDDALREGRAAPAEQAGIRHLPDDARRADVDCKALASSGTSTCGITLVNHDPGPSTTRSAAA